MKRLLAVPLVVAVSLSLGCSNAGGILGTPKPGERPGSDASRSEISTWMARAGYHGYFEGRASGRDGFAGVDNAYGSEPLRVTDVAERDCRLTFTLTFGDASKPPLDKYRCETALVFPRDRSINAIQMNYQDGGRIQNYTYIQYGTGSHEHGIVCEDAAHHMFTGDFIHLPMAPALQSVVRRWSDLCSSELGSRADAYAKALESKYAAYEAATKPMPTRCSRAQTECNPELLPPFQRPSNPDPSRQQRACEFYASDCKGKYKDAE